MHLDGLDLNLLVAFRALMLHRNVTRAARELSITQPALSHALSRLREHYEDPLFYYDKGAMHPSPRALEIYEPIAKALKQITGTFHSAFDPSSVHRTFGIGLVGYVAFFLIPVLMLRLRAEAPGIQLTADYMTAKEADRLLGGPDLDVALGVLQNNNPTHIQEPMVIDRFVVIARRGHGEIRGELKLETYARLAHIGIPLYTDLIDKGLRSQGVIRKFLVETENLWDVPFQVSRSDLLATIPERIAFVFRQFCPLDVFPTPFPIPDYRVNIVWHRRAHGDAAHAWLRAVVRATASDIYRDLGAPNVNP